GRPMELWVGNSLIQPPDPTTYYRYELAAQRPVQKYDIDKGVVKPTGLEAQGAAPAPSMLGVKQNSQVLYAAIDRDHGLAAFVGGGGSHPSLVIVPNPDQGKAAVARKLPATDAVSRPAWIPGADALLVAWGGQLWMVDRAGAASRVPAPGLNGITEVSVSPDGRRVALIAGGQGTISVLTVEPAGAPGTRRVGGQPPAGRGDPHPATTRGAP